MRHFEETYFINNVIKGIEKIEKELSKRATHTVYYPKNLDALKHSTTFRWFMEVLEEGTGTQIENFFAAIHFQWDLKRIDERTITYYLKLKNGNTMIVGQMHDGKAVEPRNIIVGGIYEEVAHKKNGERLDHMFHCMAEEAGELAQEAGKSGRLGWAFKRDEYKTNLERMELEMLDSIAIFMAIQEEISGAGFNMAEFIDQRFDRIRRKWHVLDMELLIKKQGLPTVPPTHFRECVDYYAECQKHDWLFSRDQKGEYHPEVYISLERDLEKLEATRFKTVWHQAIFASFENSKMKKV